MPATAVVCFALTALIVDSPLGLSFKAIRENDRRAALIGTVGPLLTIVFSWLLLGEAISAAQLTGVALVVAGVMIVSRR